MKLFLREPYGCNLTVKASDDKLLIAYQLHIDNLLSISAGMLFLCCKMILRVASYWLRVVKTITKTRNKESTKLKPFRVFACPVGQADRTGVLSCFRDKKVIVIGLSGMIFVT